MNRGVGLVGTREGQTFAGLLSRRPMFIGGTNGLKTFGGRMLLCSTKVFESTFKVAASVVGVNIIVAKSEIVAKNLAAFFI